MIELHRIGLLINGKCPALLIIYNEDDFILLNKTKSYDHTYYCRDYCIAGHHFCFHVQLISEIEKQS